MTTRSRLGTLNLESELIVPPLPLSIRTILLAPLWLCFIVSESFAGGAGLVAVELEKSAASLEPINVSIKSVVCFFCEP